MLQQVSGLIEYLHALGALKRPVLAHHALMLVRVCKVGYIMAAGSALVPAFAPDLQRGLLGWHRVLLGMLAVLGLLQSWVGRQDDAVHSTAQGVLSPLKEGVRNRRGCHCMLLLPCLGHPSAVHVWTHSRGTQRD